MAWVWRNAVHILIFSSLASSRQVPRSTANDGQIAERDLASDYDQVLQKFLVNPTCSTGGGSDQGQQIAVASYINPTGDPAAWTRLFGYPKSKLSILVANVVNGPDSVMDAAWKSVIDQGKASGKIVLGYVRTGYLSLNAAYTPNGEPFKTRLGSTDLADWAAQIQADVDMWYRLYGDSMGGIFFDEGWMECGPNNIYANLYKYINDYTKRTHPGALTVLNPGSPTASCYEATMDTLMTFELSYEAYLTKYVPNNWVAKDKQKIWHIIYNVPESEIEAVAKLAHDRGAGYIQITNDIMPNPYDNLPGESYMQRHLNAVEGGVPLNQAPSAWATGAGVDMVTNLVATGTDYSSTKLSWNSVANALGYNVYLQEGAGGAWRLAASIPAPMTAVTFGGLQPDTVNGIYVAAIGGDGALGSRSTIVTAKTLPLPDGKAVTNLSASPSGSSTVFKADVLLPYAFIRLYIWDAVECDFENDPGWPINFKSDAYVCTHYMVEGDNFYKYTGTLPAGSTNAPWSWASLGDPLQTAPKVTGAYTRTWTLPVGTLTTDTSKFLIQVQGYNPFNNVFQPKPDDYDCKGSSMCTTPDFVKWCDHAANTLTRRDDFFYITNGTASQSGNCWGDMTRGCGLFIQGDSTCRISGTDLWWAYQNIRSIGGCKRCGSFHMANSCLITVNYVYECENHS